MKRKLDHILNRSPATSAAGVGLVACPVCHKQVCLAHKAFRETKKKLCANIRKLFKQCVQVPSVNINAHLDTTCALNSIEGIARYVTCFELLICFYRSLASLHLPALW